MADAPEPIRFDLAVLIASIEENRASAEAASFGTLDYLLGCALREAQRLAELEREERRDGDRWKPV